MITAVDTNVLLDVFLPDPVHGPRSADALRESLNRGSVVACEVVWAEFAAVFADAPSASAALAGLPVGFSPLDQDATLDAARMWADHRRRRGGRERIVPDFLVAAHARAHADRLLTRDRGFFRRYAENLDLIDPSR